MGSLGEEDLGRQREKVVCRQKHHPQLKILLLACPKECGPRCEIVGTVSRRLIVRPSLCTRDLHRTRTCTGWWTRCALHGYCDFIRAHASWGFTAIMRLAQAISVHGKVASSAHHNLHRFAMSHFTRDYGQTSSWYKKGWASGWSKRATRGYQANYDRDDRGMIMHREDRIMPAEHHPRHRLLQMSRLWTNATRTRECLCEQCRRQWSRYRHLGPCGRHCHRKGCHNTATG